MDYTKFQTKRISNHTYKETDKKKKSKSKKVLKG